MQVTVDVPTGKDDPVGGVQVTALTPGQLSVAVAVYVVVAEHDPIIAGMLWFAGHVTTGFSLSLTVTVNVQLPGLPDASVAVQVTVDVPTGNDEPDGGTQVGVLTPGQLSVAVAV